MKICLIPARGGSKRIKNKNIVNFFGKPIISYSINTAIKSKLFDKVIVSTDSKKIANISSRYGALIPFMRPKNVSNDYAVDEDVIEHFLNFAKKKGMSVDVLCYMYPVNPLLKISTLIKCKNLLKKSNCHRVMTVGKYSTPIQKALKKNTRNEILFKEVRNSYVRSQDLGEYYFDAGQCYWFNIKKIKNIKEFRKPSFKTLAIELGDLEFWDVDNPKDLITLQKIYKLNKYSIIKK